MQCQLKKRQAGDHSYGDEPSLPTQAAYEVIEITTFVPVPEEEVQAVKNGLPVSPPMVTEEGDKPELARMVINYLP
ncbi:hypothetical protein KIN20_029761 [Parelaphostrongylus tenuis]|uniref:Uncharacterized protein n=1 Tax=Parelaphostrongylus tenuis TaxID=148309 RepID=A0AAD5R391_PARTN|nr:hypothetical protein KIN20_029761 [Parelaphostrongylus tenuis]